MRRRWLAGIFAVSATWAVLVVVISSDHVHQIWGEMAAVGYGLALAVVLAVRHARTADIALGLAFLGGLVAPLGWMAAHSDAATGRGLLQPEVWVVARSGISLLHHGTPYAGPAALVGVQDPNAYNPYLPVMALFGLPRAWFNLGLLTDPRVWFGVVFLFIFWLALREGGARDPIRWAMLVGASPVIAFELAVGGTDVPMVAFLCLGFAYLWARKPVLAGLALGIGASMKATAWPALLVAVALLAARQGKRTVGAFTLTVHREPPEGPGGQHDQVPAGAGQRPVGGAQPATGVRHRVDLAPHRAHDRRGAARAGRPRRRGLARLQAAAIGTAGGDTARRGDDAHVRARPVHPVRLLHLPGRAGDLADRDVGRPAGGRGRARQDLGGLPASSRTRGPTSHVTPRAARCS
jgi:hypothetical protein